METNSTKILKRLQKEGWVIERIKGSHHILKKDGKTIILPHPKKDLPKGTARDINKRAGWI